LLSEVQGLGVECSLTERRSVPDNLARAERRGLRYVMVMGRQNENNGTVALHIFRSGGKSESKRLLASCNIAAINEISYREAIEIIRREEQIIATNFLPPHQHYGINPNQPIPNAFPSVQGNFFPNNLPSVQTPAYGNVPSNPQLSMSNPLQNLDANTISRLLSVLQQPPVVQPTQPLVTNSYLSGKL
jgi:hypothetical protein